MAGFRIEGSSSGNVAEVDNNNNQLVNLPLTQTQAGFASVVTENDKGTITGTRLMKEGFSSDDYRLSVGMSTPLFDYNFIGTAQATGQWKCLFTTMTMTESSGSILLNANNTATTTTGCALSTWRYFKLQSGGQLYAVCNAIMATNAMEAGQIFECGLFLPTATTPPADGAYFRITSAGTLGVVNFNGTETVVTFPAGNFPTGSVLVSGTMYRLGININTQITEFWINDILAGTVPTPTGNGVPFSSVALPYSFQQRNSGAVSVTQAQFKVMAVHVEQDDLQMAIPMSHVLAAAGQMSYQTQEGAAVGANTATFPATTAAPTIGVPVNTTALVTGLGGSFGLTITQAINTDGIAFDFTVPVGTVSIQARTLIITGVQIQGCVTLIFSGGPISNAWYLAFGHTAISLATGESATFASGTTKLPRKIAIGIDTYAATSVVGTLGSTVPLELDLTQAPVAVNPGEHVAIVVRNLQAAGTTGTITYVATVKGYWI